MIRMLSNKNRVVEVPMDMWTNGKRKERADPAITTATRARAPELLALAFCLPAFVGTCSRMRRPSGDPNAAWR